VGSTPLAVPGREVEVARFATGALNSCYPRADCLLLHGVPDAQPWARLLAEQWPGAMRRLIRREYVTEEALIDCVDGYEGWLGRRSARFRSQLRRHQRRLEALGIRRRVTSTQDELTVDVPALVRLHRARWTDRGGSGVMSAEVEQMLVQATPRLLEQGRMTLLSLETDERIVSSNLLLNAGRRHLGWLTGSDPELSREPLDFVSIVAGIEHVLATGAIGFSLGPGRSEAKRRMTDSTGTISTWRLPLRGPRSGLVVGSLAVRSAHERYVGHLAGPTGEKLSESTAS
jgi:CelD/BcsL family acetyltransferase involved in cellulose biosynthesis